MRTLLWMMLGSSVWLTGCATVYLPAPPQIALLEDQGDVQISGYTGTGTGGAVAYAVTDYFSVRGGGHKSEWSRPSYLVEGGVGFTNAVRPDPARPEYGGRFGVTVDVGGGRAQDTYQEFTLFEQDEDPQTYTYNASVWSVSSRGFGAFESEHFAVGGVVGVTVQQHYLREGTHMVPRPESVTNYSFIEPGIFLRLGANPVYFEGQIGYSLPLEEMPVNVTGFPLMLGLGLVVELGRMPEGEWY